VLAALGALSLSYATGVLSGITPRFIYPLLAFLYIYAMHILNRFLDKGASTYNDPEKAAFYRKYRIVLVITGIASAIIALILSYFLGTKIYLLMAVLCILGVIYSIPLVPMSLRHLWRYSKIKDIPGSKSLSEALAWAAVVSLLPLLGKDPIRLSSTVITFYLVISMVYVRAAVFDILQVQGDMIVGKETLPIILGEKRTLLLLKGIIIVAILVLIILPFIHMATYFSFFLLICFILLTISLISYERGRIHSEPLIEYLVEASFILTGLLALLWQGLT
jgi:4-hydroxy-3-methylbut-2-enyl diphosphate reductase